MTINAAHEPTCMKSSKLVLVSLMLSGSWNGLKFECTGKMSTKIIQSEKGKPLLVLDDFKYRKKKYLKTGECFWTCSVSTCNGKVYTLGSEYAITRKDTTHNHEKKIENNSRQIVKSARKRKYVFITYTLMVSSQYNINNRYTIYEKYSKDYHMSYWYLQIAHFLIKIN